STLYPFMTPLPPSSTLFPYTTLFRSLFFEHKKMYRSVRGDVPDGEFTVPIGRAQVTRQGTQVTVVAYGLMAHYALEAADRAADRSEEHTSELQSRFDLVCRLLLEKKK